MTYKFAQSKLGYYFQSGNEDLPLDNLRSFWPLRASVSASYGQADDLLGNHPAAATGTLGWANTNPVSGAEIGSVDFSAGTAYLMTRGDSQTYVADNLGLKWWMSFWLYPKTGSSGDVPVSRGAFGAGWFVYINATDNLEIQIGTGAAFSFGTTSNTLNYDAWNFGVVGYDGSTGFVSLNGGTAATVTATMTNATTNGITFGNWYTGGNAFSGYLADAAYFVDVSANATATEIAALYNGGNGNTLLRG